MRSAKSQRCQFGPNSGQGDAWPPQSLTVDRQASTGSALTSSRPAITTLPSPQALPGTPFKSHLKVATNLDRVENCNPMSFQSLSTTSALRRLSVGLSIAALLLFFAGGPKLTTAQDTKQAKDATKESGNASLVDRGKYIVVGIAACGNCHTPRKDNGEFDYSQWLAGAPVPYLSARPDPDWPIRAPRIAGLPPMPDAQMITLLTTGICANTGKPLRLPMPSFHMTRADAEAVLAYLKSLTPGRDTTQ